MTPAHILAVLRARWSVILAAVLLTGSAAGIVSWSLPKQYTASSSLVIDARSPDPINGTMIGSNSLSSYIATQIDVIESERVIRKAIQALKLNQNPQLVAQWREATEGRGVFETWLAGAISKGILATPSRESSVITLNYSATDPAFAAAMTNALVQAYIDTLLELRIEPAKQFNRLFDEQAKVARERLEAAQAKLSDYQKEKGLVTTDERLDVETTRLNELSAQVVALQSMTADALSKKAQAGLNSPEVLGNSVVAALRADASRQEAKLKELSARLGAAHPQVVELQASINELRTKIEAESRAVTSSVGLSSAAVQQREAQMRGALEAQREKVLRLKAQRDEAAVLVRDVESAQRTYDNIQARFSQTNLESQSNQTNISVLNAATPPPFPSGPRILLNTLIAAIGGLLLGIASALAFELYDRRLRTLSDITENMQVPGLGMMPFVKEVRNDGAKVGVVPRLAVGRSLPELAAPTKKQ